MREGWEMDDGIGWVEKERRTSAFSSEQSLRRVSAGAYHLFTTRPQTGSKNSHVEQRYASDKLKHEPHLVIKILHNFVDFFAYR